MVGCGAPGGCAGRSGFFPALAGALIVRDTHLPPAPTAFTRRTPGLPKRTRGSEFMMIFAHVVAAYGASDAKFDPGLMPPATIHRRSDDAQIDRALSLVESGVAKIFAVYGSRIGTLPPAAAHRLRALWASRQLDAEEILSRLG
jgi:hypothetical protein